MLSRVSVHVVNAGGPSRFYTYKDLAEMWRVREQTIRVWVMQLRRGGRGPNPQQMRVVQRHAALRVALIRQDYAELIQRIKVEGLK